MTVTSIDTTFFEKEDFYSPFNEKAELIIKRIMEYINEFHKEWIERTRQSIASWSKQPASLEEKKRQQEHLNLQKAIREGKSKG